MKQARPKVAVYKFSSCDGCQLAILCLEDELLTLAEKVDIANFLEARSRVVDGPYDITFVEGSITTEEERERIQRIRENSKYLVAIGACAVSGGIQALRNWIHVDAFVQAIYATPEHIHTLATSTPIADHVHVDLELSGCPVNKRQLLTVIASLLRGRIPDVPPHAVCIDCKLNGTPCVMVAQDVVCLGPLTRTGCNALCPSFGRGCYGCFGPSDMSKPETLAEHLKGRRTATPEIIRRLRGINGWSPKFRAATEKLEKTTP
jgi:coenzyme F420-reducing hydrogenase gamma subunit